MSQISAVDASKPYNMMGATYNAVKIQINEPKTCIPQNLNGTVENNGTYNGVDIEVNKPSVQNCDHHHHRSCYDYPCAECAVSAEYAPIHPVNVPVLPVVPMAYQETRYIASGTRIDAQPLVENDGEDIDIPDEVVVYSEEVIDVPEPSIATVAEENNDENNVVFNGLNFKADSAKKSIEILPPVDIMPEVDVPAVIANLSNSNFEIQAKQMEEIARVSIEDSQAVVPYIVTEVFSELINIVNKDTSDLTPPSEKQIDLRKQIIINELIKEQASEASEENAVVELPYQLSDADIEEAMVLSSMEQAERNKEYAIYTMAILSKVYTEEVEKHTGSVVPLTDLPGASTIIDTLRHDNNSSVKVSAIDALNYLYRPEYKEEIIDILKMTTTDTNAFVAQNAQVVLNNLN